MDRTEIYETLNRAYFSDDPHEQEVIAHLGLLAEGAKLAADVGASLGQYTRRLSEIMRDGEIHSFEADPIRAEELARNCSTWSDKSGNRITAHHAAMSDEPQPITFFVTNSDVSGGLTKHETPRPVDWEEIEIPAQTLDDAFPERAPDFIKIDVEGAELAVLRGATRVLNDGSPVLLIELHWGDNREPRALLRNAGYRHTYFYGQSIFVKPAGLWARLMWLDARRGPVDFLRRQVRLRRR